MSVDKAELCDSLLTWVSCAPGWVVSPELTGDSGQESKQPHLRVPGGSRTVYGHLCVQRSCYCRFARLPVEARFSLLANRANLKGKHWGNLIHWGCCCHLIYSSALSALVDSPKAQRIHSWKYEITSPIQGEKTNPPVWYFYTLKANSLNSWLL